MLAKAILVHGVIGYKFCWLLPSENHNQGIPAGHEPVETPIGNESPLLQASISIQPTKPVSPSKLSPTCGILPKKCHVALSPLHTQTIPLAMRGIAHSTRGRILSGRCPIFSRYLTPGILSGLRSTFLAYFTPGSWRRMGEGTIQLSQSDMSRSSDGPYPDSLARQTLMIRRIYFRLESKSKLR